MGKDKTITIGARVIDARYDVTSNEVLIRLDADGRRLAVRLNSESIFGGDVEASYMRQYAEAMSRRTMPIKLEVLESQLKEDKE